MTQIYVASSWRNPEQPAVVAALKEAGFSVYDFKNPAPGNTGFSWSSIDPNWKSWTPEQFIEGLKHPIAQAGFKCDMDALKACDVCVLVLPCGRSAHLEIGWAAGAGKKTIILQTKPEEPELMSLMVNYIVTDIKRVIEIIKAWESASHEIQWEDPQAENMRNRRTYLRDARVGPAIDFIVEKTWNDYSDPLPFSWLTVQRMKDVTREFLIIGRFCANMIYSLDHPEGFSDMIPNDPDSIEITPVPARGWDPLISLVVKSTLESLLESADERLLRLRAHLSPETFKRLATEGRFPLDTYCTLFIARKVSPYDYVGTSIIPRITDKSLVEITPEHSEALREVILTAFEKKKSIAADAKAGKIFPNQGDK